MRDGYASLHASLPEDRWVILGDTTIDIGKVKALVTVGVSVEKLQERGDYTISRQDLRILGIHPTEHATGEHAAQALMEAQERVGGPESVAAYVTDGGSELGKGGRLVQETQPKAKFLYDLAHKLALVVEKELLADPLWEKYTRRISEMRNLIQQTEFAPLMPPKLRSKERFMSISLQFKWAAKIRESEKVGHFADIPKERYEKYFGWIADFEPSIKAWATKIAFVEWMKAVLRKEGLSEEAYHRLIDETETPSDKNLESFVCRAVEAIGDEISKIDVGQTLPVFTEALESLFGAYKYHASQGGHGITGNILTVGALTGPSRTAEEICKIMEATPVRTALGWVKERICDTVGSLRRQFFKKSTGGFDGMPLPT